MKKRNYEVFVHYFSVVYLFIWLWRGCWWSRWPPDVV